MCLLHLISLLLVAGHKGICFLFGDFNLSRSLIILGVRAGRLVFVITLVINLTITFILGLFLFTIIILRLIISIAFNMMSLSQIA